MLPSVSCGAPLDPNGEHLAIEFARDLWKPPAAYCQEPKATMSDPPAKIKDEAASAIEEVKALHARGRFDEAQQALEAILATQPDDAEAWGWRGLLDFERGQLASAASFTARAASLAPTVALYPARLGAIRRTEGRLSDALEFYRQALMLPSAHQESLWHEVGNVLFELGDNAQACVAYRKVLELAPKSAGTLNNLGNALCNLANQTGDIDIANQALDAYRRALSISPKFAGARMSLSRAMIERARILLSRRDVNGALNAVRDALRNDGQKKRPKLIVAHRQQAAANRGPSIPARRFSHASVLSGDRAWYVLSSDNKLYIDDMSSGNGEMDSYVRVSARDGATIMQLDAERHAIRQPCFLLGGSRNYYHWMVDYFPRLSVLDTTNDLPLLVNADLTGFQRECLARVGIAEERLLAVPMPSIVDCTDVVAPLAASDRQRLQPSAAAWLRDAFLAPSIAVSGKRLYVSRRDASLRRLVNEDELVAELRKFDFELIVPGQMTVEGQARTFAEAAIIVGPHGSGLTNMVFAPSRASVVELTAGHRQRRSFMAELAAGLGLEWHQVQCWALPTPEQRNMAHDQDQDMVAPVSDVIRGISALIQRKG
jgi:capsular polysaccharide biosynthesis protein/Flp pilus assembly protein TadD